MKINIANIRTYYFSDSIEPPERLIEVNKMLEDVLVFDGKSMTVEEYFSSTWLKERDGVNHSRDTMDKIGFYLSKMPEQNGRHDKEILSRNDDLEMNKGVRRVTRDGEKVYIPSRYMPFTDLDKEASAELGLIDNEAFLE